MTSVESTESAHVRTPEEARRDLELAWSSRRGVPGVLTAVNHKQVGKRFIWTAVAFLLVGGIEGLLIRTQLARAENTFLSPEAYNQVFTMHGTTMMFLFAVPVLEGLAMYLAPLQLGTRDLPFPRLNAFGYWMYLAGGILLNWSFLTGSVPDGGWFAYTPLTGPEFSPDRGMDFWLIGVTFVEVAGIVGAVELIVLVVRTRAPGMSLGRIPLFSWSVLLMGAMMLMAFPFVLGASLLLELERKFGAPFYDPAGGGNPLLWQHLFWIFGHPEVYIMLVPATGIVSAVVAAHTRHPIVAYPLVVAALVGIAIVSFGLWVHHMFTVGLPVMVLSLFAVASYFIAIPSGIQVFAWIATIWEGRPRWRTPMWFVAGFLFIFVLGGITGVMVATAPFDGQAHDSFFVVAHFHYVLIGGVVFPVFAGLHHWLPKLTGRVPSEVGGKLGFWLMFIGFNVTFFPQHWLGLQGMARRVYTYDASFGWETTNLVSTIGAFVLAGGVLVFIANLAHGWRAGPLAGDDPWEADSLEWATTSPPATYDFERTPVVGGRSPLWEDASHDLEPAVARGVAVTARPWRGRREVIRTSVIDGRPEAIVPLPGPTAWPLFAALGISVAGVGVLVNWYVLAAVGAAGIVLSLWRWIGTNIAASRWSVDDVGDGEDEMLATARADAARAFRSTTAPSRTLTWWGIVVGMVGVGTVAGALAYSFFYLRLGAGQWPPAGTDLPAIGPPLIALALVAAATAVAPWTAAGPFRLAIAATGGAVAVAVQVAALLASEQSIDAHAYEAIIVVMEVASAAVLSAAVAIRAGGAVVLHRDPSSAEAVSAEGALWGAAVVIWVALWLVIHVAPRVV